MLAFIYNDLLMKLLQSPCKVYLWIERCSVSVENVYYSLKIISFFTCSTLNCRPTACSLTSLVGYWYIQRPSVCMNFRISHQTQANEWTLTRNTLKHHAGRLFVGSALIHTPYSSNARMRSLQLPVEKIDNNTTMWLSFNWLQFQEKPVEIFVRRHSGPNEKFK